MGIIEKPWSWSYNLFGSSTVHRIWSYEQQIWRREREGEYTVEMWKILNAHVAWERNRCRVWTIEKINKQIEKEKDKGSDGDRTMQHLDDQSTWSKVREDPSLNLSLILLKKQKKNLSLIIAFIGFFMFVSVV